MVMMRYHDIVCEAIQARLPRPARHRRSDRWDQSAEQRERRVRSGPSGPGPDVDDGRRRFDRGAGEEQPADAGNLESVPAHGRPGPAHRLRRGDVLVRAPGHARVEIDVVAMEVSDRLVDAGARCGPRLDRGRRVAEEAGDHEVEEMMSLRRRAPAGEGRDVPATVIAPLRTAQDAVPARVILRFAGGAYTREAAQRSDPADQIGAVCNER